jgi:hypothetical protein
LIEFAAPIRLHKNIFKSLPGKQNKFAHFLCITYYNSLLVNLFIIEEKEAVSIKGRSCRRRRLIIDDLIADFAGAERPFLSLTGWTGPARWACAGEGGEARQAGAGAAGVGPRSAPVLTVAHVQAAQRSTGQIQG